MHAHCTRTHKHTQTPTVNYGVVHVHRLLQGHFARSHYVFLVALFTQGGEKNCGFAKKERNQKQKQKKKTTKKQKNNPNTLSIILK